MAIPVPLELAGETTVILLCDLPVGGSGKMFFATNYIQYANCTGSEFTLTLGTCDGTGMVTQTGGRL